MRKTLLLILIAITFTSFAQVAINTDGSNPNNSAILDLKSTSRGFLPPRMTSTQMQSISSPVAGLMVFNTSVNSICFFDGSGWKSMYSNDGKSCGTISYGGQTYQTVILGTQCWMAENLNIGTAILGSQNQTNNGVIEKYCYDNNTSNCDTYGGLYQWDEMMQYITTAGTQGICPTGWHLPTDTEWKTLEMQLGMTQAQADSTGYRGTDEGSQLAGNESLWSDGNLDQNTNFGTSGFDALPGGYRHWNGTFYQLTNNTYFWSSSESGSNAWIRMLYYTTAEVERLSSYQPNGYSVRCVRD